MTSLEDNSKEYTDYLLKKYSKRYSNEEDKLISDMREFAPSYFFLPFLQYFIENSFIQNKTINSKYILKILINNSNLLDEKDVVTNIDNGTGIKIKEGTFIVPGIIVRTLLRQNLKESYKLLIDMIKKINISEIQEYIFDYVDKDKLIDKIYEEYNSQSEKPLIDGNKAKT